MSKAAQFEADEKQRSSQPLYPQVAQPAQPYYGQPVYQVQHGHMQQGQVLQAYPPSQVVVINQIAPSSNGWRDPGCCTICWGVFLLIFSILSSGLSIYAVNLSPVVPSKLNNCDPSYPSWPRCNVTAPSNMTMPSASSSVPTIFHSIGSTGVGTNILNLVLTVAVVVFYCKKSNAPAARAWNYTCWILIAILQAGIVVVMFVYSMAVTLGAALFGAVVHSAKTPSNKDGVNAVDGALTIFTVVFWVATLLCAIPMIVSSVVAHQNRAPCSCSTRQTDYVD